MSQSKPDHFIDDIPAYQRPRASSTKAFQDAIIKGSVKPVILDGINQTPSIEAPRNGEWIEVTLPPSTGTATEFLLLTTHSGNPICFLRYDDSNPQEPAIVHSHPIESSAFDTRFPLKSGNDGTMMLIGRENELTYPDYVSKKHCWVNLQVPTNIPGIKVGGAAAVLRVSFSDANSTNGTRVFRYTRNR